MSTLIFVLSLFAAGVVLMRSTCVAASLSRRDWDGHTLQFIGITGSYGLVCGGAVGIPLGWSPGPVLLLIGVAGWIVFDHRRK